MTTNPKYSLYLVISGKINFFALLLFLVACVTNCQNKKQHKQWVDATIDPSIANNAAYRELDKEAEEFSLFEAGDTSKKRTSSVMYFANGPTRHSDSNFARQNNCRAYYFPGDTLSITLGLEMVLPVTALLLTITTRGFIQSLISSLT
jgi:hypothetical protein